MRRRMGEGIDYDALVKDDCVHADCYLDPDIFAAEIERIFSQGWVYVGHESEVPEPDDFRLSWIGRQPVILVRDAEGTVRVLLNRCTHRAATVCQIERGSTRLFRCGYHGWAFSTSGALVAVPFEDGYGPDFCKEALGLRQPPRLASYRGFVFASLAPSGISLDAHLGSAAKAQIDLFCDQSPAGELVLRAGTNKLAYNANWKLQMENSIDGYHPNFTHGGYLTNVARQTGHKVDVFEGGSIGRSRALGHGHAMLDYRPYNAIHPATRARLERLKSTPWGRRYYDDLVARHGRERAEEVLIAGGTHMNIFPNLVILQNQVRTIRPVHVDRTEVYMSPALLKGVPDGLNTMRLRAHESFYGPGGGGIHDDIEMFERVRLGLEATLDPWLRFWRGRHREQRDNDGTLFAQMTDEVPQRAMWQHWKALMQSEAQAEAAMGAQA